MDRILTIVGPTGVGKTRIAIEIAKKISGQIISADSRQIYKYLNIGTAKPTAEERNDIEFHLIDFIHPNSNYSCGQYRRDAETAIEQIKKTGNVPIICGGTGLYIKALFNPLHILPQSDEGLKEKLTQVLQTDGIEHLYQRLLSVDPKWARKIGSNDKQRILRGIEVYEITGKPLSKLLERKRTQSKYLPYYIGLNLSREELYKRIDRRFDTMLENGLVEEVKSLLHKSFSPQLNALQTIGYKEIITFLGGKITLDVAIHKAKQRTRNFAKRQIAWFSKIPDVLWFNPNDSGIIKKILASLD